MARYEKSGRRRNPYLGRVYNQPHRSGEIYQNRSDRYRPNPAAHESPPVTAHSSKSNPYRRFTSDYEPEPDVERLLEKLENNLRENSFRQRVDEILERMNAEPEKDLAEYFQSASESEPDLETENLRVEREDFEKDLALSGEAEAFLERLADEEVDEKSDDATVEPVDIPYRPPEEAMRPAETIEEIAQAVLDDPLLAQDLEPEVLRDVEVLVHDYLPLEQLEPEEEHVEPGY